LSEVIRRRAARRSKSGISYLDTNEVIPLESQWGTGYESYDRIIIGTEGLTRHRDPRGRLDGDAILGQSVPRNGWVSENVALPQQHYHFGRCERVVNERSLVHSAVDSEVNIQERGELRMFHEGSDPPRR
jgi:hypothetical protein